MENEKRLVELMADMLIKQDEMIDELKGANKRLEHLDTQIVDVKSELIKLNLQTSQNTRAILKLANEVENIADLNERVTKLEKVVYK